MAIFQVWAIEMTFDDSVRLVSASLVHLSSVLLYGYAAVQSLKYVKLSVKHGTEEPHFWLYCLTGVVCVSVIIMDVEWSLDSRFRVDGAAEIMWSLLDIARAAVIILALSILNSRFHQRWSDD